VYVDLAQKSGIEALAGRYPMQEILKPVPFLP